MKVHVIIDVLRAFTVAHFAFMRGVSRIYLVTTIQEAFALKSLYPEYLLAGEKDGLPIEGFDLDNSPAALLTHHLDGKTLIQKTSNGTKATLENLDAQRVFVTGLSNSFDLVAYLQTLCIETLHIIPSRLKDDDFAVKDYMLALYNNQKVSQLEIIERIINSDVASKFFTDDRFNPKDVVLATTEIKCEFVMEVKSDESGVFIEKCIVV